MKQALLVIGHGSRDREGIEEFLELGEGLAQRRGRQPTAVSFLEFARPTIGEAIDRLVAEGAEQIVCVPGMLFAAGHVKNDVPSELHAAQQRWPAIDFRMGRALDMHPKLLELCRVRWQDTLHTHPPRLAKATLLLVVGRGASDPDANADVARLTRFLSEGYGTGWASTCFSGVTAPLVPEALEVAVRSGFPRIVVQPYFLFTGVLVKKIHEWTRQCAAEHPELEIFATSQLGVHPLLVDVFEERAQEAVHGAPAMNCQHCKYRVQIIGHEPSLGLPQTGHHHHVRGIESHYHQLHDHAHEASHVSSHAHGHQPSHEHAQAPEHPHAWDERLVRCLAF
jgi:sirohydrochlorin cobaltochelatase